MKLLRRLAYVSPRFIWWPHLEKAQTKSLGRALAAVGYGSQFTDEEFNEGERIVDSPVERKPAAMSGNGHAETKVPDRDEPTSQQLNEIKRPANLLDRQITKPKTYRDANILHAELAREYNAAQAAQLK